MNASTPRATKQREETRVDLRARGYDKVVALAEKGVDIPHPSSVYVDDDVDVDRISGDGVTIMPGCRIHGSTTVISEGCRLGAGGPVSLEDCLLGPRVELQGGHFRKSVFLEGANMGPGAQVREGCILEEQANGAHCVGLKQTILFPFVTLGSLINFCDCLMSGGTSRQDHSEVGSSYIHFNYTPDGDKTTPSLFGDVPRGVMLDQPPVFLGGQGGAVGPVRVGFGTVVAAGSILRHDVLEDGRLVAVDPIPGFERSRRPNTYRDLTRVVRNNVLYVANLAALEHWYRDVRAPFFSMQPLGDLVFEGALATLRAARNERAARVEAMAAKVPDSVTGGAQLRERAGVLCDLLREGPGSAGRPEWTGPEVPTSPTSNYLETVKALTPAERAAGIQWLERIAGALCVQASEILDTMYLFERPH